MKNKGISLIVLIITVVVIIILGTAIIVNIARTNIIENANESVVKQDFKTFQDELNLYIADEFAKTQGKFKAEELNLTAKDEIAKIIPSIKGTKYENYIVIENGKIAIVDTMPEKEKTWAMEALGLISTSNNTPTEPETPVEPDLPVVDTTAPTEPTNLELTVTGNVITAVASGSTDDNDFVYEYGIDNTNWQESEEFKDLENEKEYTVYARARDNAGNVSNTINKNIKTKYKIGVENEIVEGANATVYGELPSYNNPIIPVGFKAIETVDATWTDKNGDKLPDGWNNGLVIQDKDLNEFVWVPCTLDSNDTTKTLYTRRFDIFTNYNDDIKSVSNDVNAIPVSDETTQIRKYGGFYIGRYEAGVPEDANVVKNSYNVVGKPTSKNGIAVWSNIYYENANSSAKRFCDTQFVKSGLPTGIQWDTICQWISSSGVDTANSTTYGNFSNSVSPANVTGFGKKQKTGFSEHWKVNNIYDFAGNVWEWTAESGGIGRIYRGGGYPANGTVRTVLFRLDNTNGLSINYDFVGFRVVLYVI